MKHNYFWAVLAILLGLCFYLFQLIYAEAKATAIAEWNSRQMLHARQAKRGIEDFFSNIISTLSIMAASEHIIDLDDDGRREIDFAATINPSVITAVTRVDPSGRIAYTTPYNDALIGRDISDQKHMQTVMTTHLPAISDVFTAVQGYRAMALHVPVFKAKSYNGTIGVLIDFQAIAKRFLKDIRLGDTGYAWMVSEKGIELYCPVPGHTGKSVFENCREFPSILTMAEEMLKGREGTTVYRFDRIRDQQRETIKKHAVYLPITVVDSFWSIVVASSETEILASLDNFKNRLMLLAGILLLGSALLSYYGMRAWGIVREAEKRRRAESALKRIEWMLGSEKRSDPVETVSRPPSYGDLVALNHPRLILDSVGRDMLTSIVEDYLDLLDTSAAVYERNGDYALGIFSSGWCRFMDEASRALCNTPDNAEALACGKWLCHESCWTDASKTAMETGEPTDIQCSGGIRLYAHPIRAGDEVVGAINFGYGDPPTDPEALYPLAKKYRVSADTLAEHARNYESRPPFIIELAKRRLAASARLIGEIVERKRAEQERETLQGQLVQAQKMESVGRLAGGVAHDFNNMLGVILGHVDLAMDRLGPEQTIHTHLEEIRLAAERSANLTRQLLAFARKQIVTPKTIDLNDAVAGILKMLRRLIGEDIDLAWMPGASLRPVRIDPGQIDQVLANLCINARDAIADVGKVTIETGNVTIETAYCDSHLECIPGEYVMLAVSDDGCGMTKEVIEHLFEPFFTTKKTGRGTGLGLATVYGIVKQNAGFINVYSEPGEGTTFKIYLPRFAGATVDVRADTVETIPEGQGEQVLLVEDEPAILNMGRMMLERAGYRALAVNTPSEAIRAAESHADDIRLLMTDVVMPEMNGRDLADRILAIQPNLKVLFMSGYTANVIAHHGVLDEGVQFIQKPFTKKDLAVKVWEVLNR